VPQRPDRPRPVATRLAGEGAAGVCVVHPGALPRTCWAPLAEELAGESVWLLELDAIAAYRDAALRSGPPDVTVDEIADRLLAELAAIGVSERLVLAGWSFGGVIAHALADLLTPRPRHVVLLDSIAPVDDFKRPNTDLGDDVLLAWFAMYLGARGPAALRAQPAATLESGLDALRLAALEAGVVGPGTAPAGLRKLFDAYVAGLRRNNDLVGPHRPAPSTVPLTLIKARRSLLDDEDLGWRRLAPLDVLESPGDHYTMVSQALAFPLLGAAVRDALPVPTIP
jgi:thioesterase domain-containing protein